MNPLRKTIYLSLKVFVIILFTTACSSSNTEEVTDLTTDLSPDEIVNTAFAEEFPDQYESYMRNVYDEDYEHVSKLTEEVEPQLPILFHGYGFSIEYNKPRGHAHAVEDVMSIDRINEDSVGSCMTCKSTAVPALLDEMGEDYWSASFLDEVAPRTIELGEGGESEELSEYGHISIGCSDCHDPETMDLRITRPSFTNAMDRYGVDVSEANKNEMRSYACGQCHTNYYFDPETQKVTFPWDEGLRVEDMWEYYETTAQEEHDFEGEWEHSISGTTIVKAQHPEFEMWSYGPHGEAGVSCADCHMPYERGADKKKTTSHHWTSPLENVEQSCLSCHGDKSEDELLDRVDNIQERHLEALEESQDLSVKAHYYVNRMITSGADEEAIEEAQQHVREGQWFWDIVAAENSDGFHNPHGSMDSIRMSTDASNKALKVANRELSKLGEDLDELDRQIEETVQEVYDEEDPGKKHEHAVNEYFPNVLELEN
ncbi:ammonia-forming cytochrome c nitrite reductase subunit c552 [Texcoconibacillus texcoconensis]|uniref:nitrite reductase (cytochrome; ammonia-forming) n=1 Tax=Texcoconibacillus texcoconensis TaxID=1095777 RepID=A0A840QTC9_9BACI|nr:ammonia-forming cytochrome c nitrite reductase subunit c552 [Texcoconibacillus texcoconensis]MBB5174796.1 nitrite reductase (cytochrome c-552) [Texcoconibacillus texcoconensis]